MKSSPLTTSHWNGEFDFWKFIAALFILLVHSYSIFGEEVVCPHGYMAVELFFILTGFLFAQSVFKDERPFAVETIGGETWRFVSQKFWTILPYYMTGFLLVASTHGKKLFSLGFLNDACCDFLFLREFGWTSWSVQGINWYLADMFFVLFIFYPLFRWRREMFAEWIAPFLAVLLLGNLFAKYGAVASGLGVWWQFCMANTIRAMGEICLGVFSWRIARMLRDAIPAMSWLGQALSVLGVVAPTVAFTLIATGKAFYAIPLVILCFFGFVCTSGAGFQLVGKILPVSLCRWLGRCSMVLFLTHTAVRRILVVTAKCIPRLSTLFAARDTTSIAITLALYLFLCFALAIGCMVVWDAICRKRAKRTCAA